MRVHAQWLGPIVMIGLGGLDGIHGVSCTSEKTCVCACAHVGGYRILLS